MLITPPIIGNIDIPPGVNRWVGGSKDPLAGIIGFANALVGLIIVVGGLYAFLNVLFAGYQYMSAGGDSKQIEKATSKLWQSLLGLLVMAGSIVLAVIFGYLNFGDATAIISPKIYGPNPI